MKAKKTYYFGEKIVELGKPYDYKYTTDFGGWSYKGSSLTESIADELVELEILSCKEERPEMPTLDIVLKRLAERSGYKETSIGEILTKLEKVDKFAAFQVLLKEFSSYFEEVEPLQTKYGEFSTYTVHSATGKINPINVWSKDYLKNVAWFKCTEDLNWSVSQLKDLYEKVYGKH